MIHYYERESYLAANPDVIAAITNGSVPDSFSHYLCFGRREAEQGNRNLGDVFSEETYLAANPDVAAAVAAGTMESGLCHYSRYGKAEIEQGIRQPLEFYDEGMYLSTNPDVAEAIAKGVVCDGFSHYCALGKAEIESGIRRPLINRVSLAQRYITRGTGIEIGALHNPMPLPRGAKVKYVDRLSAEGLRCHYPELAKFDLVEVDIIDNGERLAKIAAGSQDFVIANHFLEHCENPIRTLKNIVKVVKPGGILFFSVPDKRHTFDKDRPLTPIKHLRRDFFFGPRFSRKRHYLQWACVASGVGPFEATPEIRRSARELLNQRYSIHYHVWTADTFGEFIDYCARSGGLGFEVQCHGLIENEIVSVLKKTGSFPEGV